jgi:hypothetical protein
MEVSSMPTETSLDVPRPNFFIVGAPKCGTTSLYSYLWQHPEVFMPRRKELHFFSTDLERPNRITEKEYFELFSEAGDRRVIGEASADYFYSRAACNRINQTFPDAKVIISLRNPVDKVYSTHAYAVWRAREEIEDFGEALERDGEYRRGKKPRRRKYIDGGKYFKYVKMYLDVFGKERVHIIIFEEMVRDPERVYKELCQFLGVRADFRVDFRRQNARRKARFKKLSVLVVPSSRFVQIGKRLIGRQRVLGNFVRWVRRWNTRLEEGIPMAPELRRGLEAEFADDVGKLSALLDRDLASYWFSGNGRESVPSPVIDTSTSTRRT